jgi:thioredoxin-related protein
MKTLSLLFLFISLNLFASEYKFENMKTIDEFSIDDEIYRSDKDVMLILNNGTCYRTSSRCYPYERKIDYLGPQINARGVEIMNMDVSFNRYHQRYNIKKLPAIIFFAKGSYITMLEPNTCAYYDRNPDCRMRNLTWVNYLLQSTLDTLNQVYHF